MEEERKMGRAPMSADKRRQLGYIRTEWGVQADVVDALISALGEGVSDVEQLVLVVEQNAVIHSGRMAIQNSMGSFLKRNYQGSTNTPALFLEDLRRQKQWLAEHGNVPPTLSRVSPSVRDAIREKYGKSESKE
jgi:hypothetical protein